jgi:putative proteasome-type protease
MLKVAEIIGSTLSRVTGVGRRQARHHATGRLGHPDRRRPAQGRGDAPLPRSIPEGNFIEATEDTPFLQIGEHKYGKPILDRVSDATDHPRRRQKRR